MNHEEIKDLINRLKDVSLQLNDEIVNLQHLQRIREASQNMGTRHSREYTSQQEPEEAHGQDEGAGKNHDQNSNRGQKKRLKVGDSARS